MNGLTWYCDHTSVDPTLSHAAYGRLAMSGQAEMVSEAVIETYQANLMLIEQKNHDLVHACRTKLVSLEQILRENETLISAYQMKLISLEQKNNAQLLTARDGAGTSSKETIQSQTQSSLHRGRMSQRQAGASPAYGRPASDLMDIHTRWARPGQSMHPTRETTPSPSNFGTDSSHTSQSAPSRPISTFANLNTMSTVKPAQSFSPSWSPSAQRDALLANYPEMDPTGVAAIRSFFDKPSLNAAPDCSLSTSTHSVSGQISQTDDLVAHSYGMVARQDNEGEITQRQQSIVCDPVAQIPTDQPGTPPERRHVCTVCDKRFSRLLILRNHMRTHSGETPFECDIPGCGMRFRQKNEQRRHQQAKHDEVKRFVCGGTAQGRAWGCGKRFARKDGLLEHQQRTEKGRQCMFDKPSVIM